MCALPKKSKEDKWHNATPFALNDQALLLAKEKGGPMRFKLLMCVCVWEIDVVKPHKARRGGQRR